MKTLAALAAVAGVVGVVIGQPAVIAAGAAVCLVLATQFMPLVIILLAVAALVVGVAVGSVLACVAAVAALAVEGFVVRSIKRANRAHH